MPKTLYFRQAWGEKENDKLIVQVWSQQSFYFLIKPRMEVIWKQLHLQATVHYQITVWIKREGHRRQPRDRVLQKSSSVCSASLLKQCNYRYWADGDVRVL